MSVINDMLNDLEQRQHRQDPQQTSSDYHDLNSVASTANRARFFWWLIGLLAVVVTVWFGWHYFTYIVTDSHAVPTPVQPIPELLESAEPALAALPAEDGLFQVDDPEPTQRAHEIPLPDVNLIQINPEQWRLNLQTQAIEFEDKPEGVAETTKAIELVFNEKPIKQKQGNPQKPAVPVVERTKYRFKTAERALANGRQKKAEKLLKEVLALQPDHLAASQLLGRLYLETGRAELAESIIATALRHAPEQAELISYFTRSLLSQERLREAGEYLYRAMQKDHASHLGLMAVIRQRQGDHQEASRYYQQALQKNPNEVTWLTGLGISQEHLGELAAARQVYRSSLASEKLSIALRGFVQERLATLENYD